MNISGRFPTLPPFLAGQFIDFTRGVIVLRTSPMMQHVIDYLVNREGDGNGIARLDGTIDARYAEFRGATRVS